MLSNDENIETIGQLVESVKHYVGLRSEYAKLDVIEKVVRLLTALVMFVILSVLLLLALIYASFAVAYALEDVVGKPMAFCIVAIVYLVALASCVVFRKKWIEQPLVRFLSNILMQE